MNKKIFAAVAATAVVAMALTACQPTPPTPQMEDDGIQMSSITDMTQGEVLSHETLDLYEFEDGEDIENDYYKRTTYDGKNVYAVKKASDGQIANLPIDNTVVYTSETDDNCYFERVEFSYKEDGEDKTMEQYQLHVLEKADEVQVSGSLDSDGAGVEVGAEAGEGADEWTDDEKEQFVQDAQDFPGMNPPEVEESLE